MYSSQRNIQVLISLLKQYGVRTIVISPGSRNMAFVRSVENDPFFTTYSVVDERSAAYFATGISLETGHPVALSSTSAQATRNYIPGMTEAFYRGAQLVFITSDYRPSLIGQGVMQAMDQMSIPVDSNRYSVNLPVIKDGADARYCERLVNEALSELDHNGTGPVHINVPTEEHWTGGVDVLPEANKISRHVSKDTYPDITGKKVVVMVGQHMPFSPELEAALEDFSKKYDAVIYANLISNYHGKRGVHANLLLEGMDMSNFKNFKPDIAISIGGQPGDYALDSKIKAAGLRHWRVSPDGKMQDTYGKLTDVFETDELSFFATYNGRVKVNAKDEYYKLWKDAVAQRVVPGNLPLSHAYIASQLVDKIPAESNVHFAILNSLRNWSYFEPKNKFYSYSNVAAFGIDGCLSTFVGHSVASDEPSFLVIGDLSFFYDMNALGIRHIKNNARIVMVNNGGGAEFRMYSNAASEFGDDANKHIAAAGHNSDAKGWVEAMGWKYILVTSKDQLNKGIEELLDESDVPVFMEVQTVMSDDSDGAKAMCQANSRKTLKAKMAGKLSPQMKRTVKKVLKR